MIHPVKGKLVNITTSLLDDEGVGCKEEVVPEKSEYAIINKMRNTDIGMFLKIKQLY